jgi:predicted enzyme related to lactoylglutathione lyase
MKILRVQNAYHVVKDMERLRSFYTSIGLPLKFSDGDRWTQFGAAGSNFSLSSVEEAPAGCAGVVVVFEVDRLDDAEALLKARGGRVMDLRNMGPHGQVLTFADPEGNIAQLFCRSGAT